MFLNSMQKCYQDFNIKKRIKPNKTPNKTAKFLIYIDKVIHNLLIENK